MELVDLTQVLFSFVGVVVLIFIFAFLAKKFGLHHRLAGMKSPEKRLEIVDALAIDPRRRLVLIKRDDVEHLIILGHQQDLHIETINHKG